MTAASQSTPASTATATDWTDEQRRGITIAGHSLLVSAAAGSGKTAVLAERCAYLVCDAPDRCSIDELLVVTFTKAAAAEMRERIERALRQRVDALGEKEDPRLTRQVALLDRASIGTLHSFCTSVLHEHFHLVGLDPAFELLDQDQAGLLRIETARAFFADRYETDESGEFQTFIDCYGDGDDESLLRRVISTHDLLCSAVDPPAWLARARQRIAEAADGSLSRSELGKDLADQIRQVLIALQERCLTTATAFNKEKGLTAYAEYVNELLATVQYWIQRFGDGALDRLADAVREFKAPRLPSVAGSTPGKDQAQAAIDAIRDDMKPKGPLGSLCRFSESEWQEGLRQTIGPTNTFLDLVAAFAARFEQAKASLRSLDFADLERLTLRILSDGKHPSAVARLFHKRFRHVLVDEYQDINEVQDAILSLVSRECVMGQMMSGGNLFCVGDVKQSIYRFRLAQPARFLDRAERFGRGNPKNGGEIIDLRTNFRSRASLLECLNGLFERLMSKPAMEIEYDDTHRLRWPVSSMYDSHPCEGPPVELHILPHAAGERDDNSECTQEEAGEFDRTKQEAAFVAAEIRRLVGGSNCPPLSILGESDGKHASRPACYGDIAILLRSMKHKADQFAEILRAAGIPVHSDSSTGFFDSMEVRDMLALLAVLDNQRQDIPLAAVLRSPLLALPAPDELMARVRLAYPAGDGTEDASVPFHLAIVRYPAEHKDALATALGGALKQLADWRDLANKRPLAEAIWTIYSRSGYLTFCAGLPDGEQRVANLLDLHARAKQFGTFARQGLGRFRQFLDSLSDESDLGQPSVSSEGDNAVRIMSIHRAKGLEYPIVFVPDLGKKHNMSSCGGSILVDRNAYVGLSVVDEKRRVRYPSLAKAMARERIRRQSLAEELRVLYVAVTRARERLILVGTCATAKAEQWRERWANHAGVIPPGTLISAQTPLDWLGPAATALSVLSPKVIDLRIHSSSDLEPVPQPARSRRTAAQEKLARLEPLDPSPAPSERAERVLHRLESGYAFDLFTTVPAARSVSAVAETGRHADFAPTLAIARSLSPDQTLSPAEIGDATHILLEHLDFTRPCTAESLKINRDKLVAGRFLGIAVAHSVDLESICCFASSELGQLMRKHAALVRRELPIYLAREEEDADSVDPLDRTMVRGRIDVLIPLPDRCILIDYKTDRVAVAGIPAQVEHHRPQIALYCQAMRAITGKPVEAYLAFLTAREWRRVM